MLAALRVDRVFGAPRREARTVFLLFPAAAARREPRARPAAFFVLFLREARLFALAIAGVLSLTVYL